MLLITCLSSGSQGNAYLVSSSTTKVLLECGIPTDTLREKLLGYNTMLTNINGVVISHHHKDHCRALKDLSKFLPCYISNEFQLETEKVNISNLLCYFNFETFCIGNIQFIPFSVKHGETPNFGFQIECEGQNILFATDMSNIEWKLTNPFDEMWLECNYIEPYIEHNIEYCTSKSERTKLERQMSTHMGLGGLAILLTKLNTTKLKRLVLIHLSKTQCDPSIACAVLQKGFVEGNCIVRSADWKGGLTR